MHVVEMHRSWRGGRSCPRVLVLALLSVGLASQASLAQAPPDAGSLSREIDRNKPPVPPPKPPPTTLDPATAKAGPGGVTVTVRAFSFKGNGLLDDATLQRAVAPFVGKTLDLAGLQAAAAAVAERYREAGWVARTLLPRQEVDGGVVQIEVIEARMGRVLLSGTPPARVPEKLLLELVQGRQQAGQPLSRAAMDRGIMLADDLPGVSVAGFLSPGTGEGQTDVTLRTSDEPIAIGDVTLDNAGSRSTGNARLSGDIYFNSPLHQGDQASLMGVLTEGSQFLRAGYQLPIGSSGLRMGVNGSALRYRLISPEFELLHARGNSQSVGVDASYPLVRSRQRNVSLNAALADRSYTNRASGIVVSDYSVQNLTLGLSANFFDEFGGGGASTLGLAVLNNRVNLAGSPNALADAQTTRTAGSSNIVRYSATRQQSLRDLIGEDFSLFASLSGQWANKNLDSSNKFYLGGVYGVRAYPSNEGSGAEGQLLNLEFRARVPSTWAAWSVC